MSDICQCGGLRMRPGVVYGWGGPICHCSLSYQPQPYGPIVWPQKPPHFPAQPQQGWECPRCRKVQAPFVRNCDCKEK